MTKNPEIKVYSFGGGYTRYELRNSLKDARDTKNWTRADLARACTFAVSVTHIEAVEKGKSDISMSKALVLASALGVPVTQLFYLKEVK